MIACVLLCVCLFAGLLFVRVIVCGVDCVCVFGCICVCVSA